MKSIDKATELFNKGFTSKASKQNALQVLSRGYEGISGSITDNILMLERTPETQDLYWNCPRELHQWRDKHSKMYSDYPESVSVIEEMIELRNAIKEADINTPVKKLDEKESVILKSIKDQMEMNQQNYVRGIDLSEKFGGLNVTCNAHLVRNAHGTVFIRHFFYMFYKLTPFNVIVAVAEKLEEDKKKENV